MLQSLLKKIKSEKSETLSKHSKEDQSSSAVEPKGDQETKFYEQLGSELEIQSDVSRIRYHAFSQQPTLYNSILACPISVFHLLPYARRKVKEIDLTRDPLPAYLRALQPILERELPEYNHVLVNVYPVGVGIMPHFDGPLYRDKVVVLSLGGPAVISFTDTYKNANKAARLLLEDHSLHIFEGHAYTHYLHGIEDFSVDSVFLQVAFPPGQHPVVLRSSVDNFHLTRFYRAVVDALRGKEEAAEVDLSKETQSSSWLVPIRDNEQYNFKIQICRTERISLTIRHRIQPPLSKP